MNASSLNIGEVVVFAAFAVLLIVRLLRRGAPNAPAWREIAGKDYVLDPANTTSVVVLGWSREELDRIVADFRAQYEMQAEPAWRVEPHATVAGRLLITFPNDIPPDLLCFLVNYIQYPKDFDLDARAVGSVAHTAIKGVRSGDAMLVGKPVRIYVPSHDADYDLVYAQIEGGSAYSVSFTDMKWRPVSDPRLPPLLDGV